MKKQFEIKKFAIITLVTSIWIHIGEVARALFAAFPRMEAFFNGRIELIGPEKFNLGIAMVWGILDTLLTAVFVFILWLCSQVFGNNTKSIIIAGTTNNVRS